MTPDVVDVAFYQEVISRVASTGQNCRYLLDSALRVDSEGMRNTIEAVLRQVARRQPITRASLERRLIRHHRHTRIHGAINALIDADFLVEADNLLEMLDPVFALWLTVEPDRRNAAFVTHSQQAMRRLLAWYEARHSQDRQEMGTLFERRVENVVRQFNGQVVPGRLLGATGAVELPSVTWAGKITVDDPRAQFGSTPDTYEVDVVTVGSQPQDCWAIDAKHRRRAITRAMVERSIRNAHAVAAARGLAFSRLWLVAPRGIRPDGLVLAQQEGILVSGLRQLEQLERLLADSPSVPRRLGDDP